MGVAGAAKADRVGVRRLTGAEAQLLARKVRDLKLPARIHQRYRIIAAARGAASVKTAAAQIGCHFTVAYDWVHRFNASGFTTFERPSNPRGRVPIVTAQQLRELMDVALSSPLERGLPFAVWTVPKLAAYCRAHDLIPPFCDEWVRRLLRGAGFSAQRIRTWKTSHDPAFDTKKKPSARSMRRGRRAPRSSASTNGGRWN
jgi:transposase